MSSAEQIREWDALLRKGKTVSLTPDDPGFPVVLAVCRRIHGASVNDADEAGNEAMAKVCAVLD